MENQLSFGPFRLLPQRRQLMEGERALRIGSRAFDILVILAEQAGTVVPYAELMSQVWRDTVVEPGSLRMHVAALRKVLGDGAGARYIVNVPLKGYSFVAPVDQAAHKAPPRSDVPPPRLDEPARADALPALLTRLVGREAAVDELTRRLPHSRCVTLVGPGGIGKTSLSLAVAHAMARAYAQGVFFVELGEVCEGGRVASALASALGVAVLPASPVQGLAAFLRDKQALIVLDNCEHVIAEVADLVERLVAMAPQLNVLVTSREPMRIRGEWIQRLGSLETPVRWQELSPRQALAFPAVQLFVERASASADDFLLGDVEVPLVCELCHRLDGIPLAIELAAASVDRLGLQGLCETLGSQLSSLVRGRRTALPRHQTLRATLDWSHDLLSESEQVLFRRLAVFAGVFALRAVTSVCSHPGTAEGVALDDVAADLVSLVGKSLVSVDISGPVVLYRLLEMNRQYARERLGRCPEAPSICRLHARYVGEIFSEAEASRGSEVLSDWQARYGRSLGDLRAALNWCFSAGGDPETGLMLAAVSAPVWFDFSLMAEYRGWAEKAFAMMPGLPGAADSLHAMKIHEAYGHALWHTRGSGPAMAEAFARALALAQQLGSARYQQRAIWGLWLICNTTGDSAGSVRLAEQFGQITGEGTDESGPTHDRMMALGLHFHGEQGRARRHALRVLEHQSKVNRVAQNSGFQFDQRVAALTVLARTLWIHGYPDQALRHGEQAVTEAQTVGHALSLCYALANGAIPVAFWAGDLSNAVRYTRLLVARATEHSLVFWQAFGEGYELLLMPAGSPDGTEPRSLARLRNPATSPLLRDTLCTIDEALFDASMLERVGVSGWCAAELTRLKGQWLLGEMGLQSAAGARDLFTQALAVAQQQEALSWELRCTESLARLEARCGAGTSWRTALEGVASRFTEGRDSTDHRRVAAFLAS